MKYVDIRDLPPCAFSPQCLRLVDDLDMPAVVSTPARMAYIEDLQDERQLRQLRTHLLSCPTCSALLAEARRMRTQQRMMLYHFLVGNEKKVPSASGAIFEAMRRDKTENEEDAFQRISSHSQIQGYFPQSAREDVAPARSRHPLRSRLLQRRGFFQNFLTLATVAAVILAAVGLLNRVANEPASGAQQPVQHGPAINNHGWGSVLVSLTVLTAAGIVKSFTLYNYHTASGQMAALMSSTQELTDVSMEGVSQDGQSLLYDVTSPDQQKTYATFSPATGSHTFYQMNAGTGGNAIWMDTSHILVQTIDGAVLELETSSNVPQRSWTIRTGRLMFYHQPFLYFIGAEQGALYRVNLAETDAVPQRITRFATDTRFWLSVDGSTIFYATKGPSGVQGIYAVSSDGSHFRMLRPGSGIPIGYGDDNALMLLAQVGDKIQVIQLGATSIQSARVVFSNAAPDATSLCGPARVMAIITLCDQNIAFAPYGDGLLLHAYYANGSNSLVYDDLATGTSRTILHLPINARVQLPGWSRMSAATGATPTANTSFSNQAARMCA